MERRLFLKGGIALIAGLGKSAANSSANAQSPYDYNAPSLANGIRYNLRHFAGILPDSIAVETMNRKTPEVLVIGAVDYGADDRLFAAYEHVVKVIIQKVHTLGLEAVVWPADDASPEMLPVRRRSSIRALSNSKYSFELPKFPAAYSADLKVYPALIGRHFAKVEEFAQGFAGWMYGNCIGTIVDDQDCWKLMHSLVDASFDKSIVLVRKAQDKTVPEILREPKAAKYDTILV